MGAASRPWASWPSMGGGLRVGERGAGPCQPQLGLGQPCRGAGHLRQRGLETPLTRKYLVVVYRETSSEDGFVLTAYLASQLSARRGTLWKR